MHRSCHGLPTQRNGSDLSMMKQKLGEPSTHCHRQLTLLEIMILLQQEACPSEDQGNHRMRKRNDDINNIDIRALQATIVNHNNMINYLINNTVNATYVTNAYIDQRTKTGVIVSSWRDWIDLICVAALVTVIVRFVFCRDNNSMCDRCSSNIFESLQKRHVAQEQQLERKNNAESIRRKPPPPQRHADPLYPRAPTISGGKIGFKNGHMSDRYGTIYLFNNKPYKTRLLLLKIPSISISTRNPISTQQIRLSYKFK